MKPKGILSSLGFNVPSSRIEWVVAGAMGAKWLHTRYTERRATRNLTTINFSSEDPSFYWLMRWLEKMPRTDKVASFKSAVQPSLHGEDSRPRAIMVPTQGASFTFRGVPCSLVKVENSPGSSIESRVHDVMQVQFQTRDLAIAEAFLQEIAECAHQKEPARVYVHTWGWNAVRKVPTDRVAILPAGQVDAVIADIRDFLGSEPWYQGAGLPYRRGYLLEGIPGSGKTSLVLAVAGAFDLNVCVLSLNGLTDEKLGEAVRHMPSNSVLLLEDIDCAFDKRTGTDRVTFAGLLNVLDGAATPDGRVTFLTTNHREKLDAALIRPGRVDFEMNFTYATADQIDEMTSRFSPKEKVHCFSSLAWAYEQISMASVQERLLKIYRPKVAA